MKRLLALLVLVASSLAGCCQRSPKELADDTAAARDFLKRLAAAHGDVAKAPPERPCTGDATRRVTNLETVDLDWLRWIPAGTGTLPALGDFSYLRTSVPAGIKPTASDWNDNANRVAELRRREYLGVLRIASKTAPVLTGPQSFQGGSFDATLVIVEVASMKPVCSTRIRAESSKDVKTKRGGRGLVAKLLEKDPAKAIQEDLKENIEQAGDAAIKKIDAQWTLRF